MIKQFKCVKCNKEWQKQNDHEVFNKFAFSKPNSKEITVCKMCRNKMKRVPN